MKAWIKAGLIGGVVGTILTVPEFLIFYLPTEAGLTIGSILGVCSGLLYMLLYPGVGVLAALWSPPPRTAKRCALDGALAGLLAFGLDALATLCVSVVFVMTGGLEAFALQFVQEFAPQTLYYAADMFASMNWLFIVLMLVCLVINVALGAGFSALGGLVIAAVKKEPPAPA